MCFGGSGNGIVAPDVLPTEKWVHLAFLYKRDGQEQAIFVNGVPVNSQTGRQSFVGQSSIFVGRGANVGRFDGRIDELQIIGRALTGEEVYDIASPLGTYVTQVLLRLRHVDDGNQGSSDGTWVDVTPSPLAANVDSWTFSPPASTRLGSTKIDLKVTDSSGHQRYQPDAWSGEVIAVDLLPEAPTYPSPLPTMTQSFPGPKWSPTSTVIR